jgi:hypothetical protein
MRKNETSSSSKKGSTRSFNMSAGHQRILTVIQLGKSNLRVGIDERLLIDSPDALLSCRHSAYPELRDNQGAPFRSRRALPFSCLAFSRARTCDSAKTWPCSCASFASRALSRLAHVSKSWRSQTLRTPVAEANSPRLVNSFLREPDSKPAGRWPSPQWPVGYALRCGSSSTVCAD